jgi:quercetin dioxygenase-like cupin family protein
MNTANEKHNDATYNRPEGERTIDAPSVAIDIPAFVRQIKNEDAWAKNDRNSITVFKTGDLRIVVCGLHQGAELLPHRAEGIMSVQVLEGELQVITDELETSVGIGHMVAIHKGSNYRVVATEESIYLLTMSNVG